MKILIILLATYLCNLQFVQAQSISTSNLYYYYSLDTINPIKSSLIGSAQVDWKLNVAKVKSTYKDEGSACYRLKYTVTLGDFDGLISLKYFVVNARNEILYEIEPSIRKNRFLLEQCLRRGQRVFFCLDGGQITMLE